MNIMSRLKKILSIFIICICIMSINPENISARTYVPPEDRYYSNIEEYGPLYVGKGAIVIGVNDIIVAFDNGIVNIPEGMTAITRNAFRDCKALTTLVIPDSVKYIENGALDGCDNLMYVLWHGHKYTSRSFLFA